MTCEVKEDGSDGQVFGYADCVPSCDCDPPSQAAYSLSAQEGEAFTQTISEATQPVEIIQIAGSSWALFESTENGVIVSGTAPSGAGVFTQVYSLKNKCGSATVTLNITVTAACSVPDNIDRDISINSTSPLVNEVFSLPEESEITNTNLPVGITASAFGDSLSITGKYTGALLETTLIGKVPEIFTHSL